MLALLAFTAAATAIGPELVERFRVEDARGPFAVSGDDVLLARDASIERRTLKDGRVRETIALPCTPIDVAADDGAWVVLCADRVVLQPRDRARAIVMLEEQSAPPVVVAFLPFFARWAVGYADGFVQRGRFEATSGTVDAEIDLRARPVALVMSGISDVTIELEDGTRHLWSHEVKDAPPARPPLVELYTDGNGTRARVSRDVVLGSARRVSGVLVAGGAPAEAVRDVALAGLTGVCARLDGAVACWGAVAPPREIPRRELPAPDGSAPARPAPVASGDDVEFEAPMDFGAPGAIAAYVSAALGAGMFTSAPFVMQALSPSLGLAPAFALAGLGAVAGVASFAVVAAAVIVVAAVILAAWPDDEKGGDWGACGPAAGMVQGAIDDCLCVLATVVAVVAGVVAAAAAGVAVLAVGAMPTVDAVLSGGIPADDPFGPTLAGAAAGGVAGWALGAGVSFLTRPLRDEDGDGEEDEGITYALDSAQVLVHVVGGSAVGAAIGYGLARGP